VRHLRRLWGRRSCRLPVWAFVGQPILAAAAFQRACRTSCGVGDFGNNAGRAARPGRAVSGERTGRDARHQGNRQQQHEPGGAARSCAVSGERTGRDARRQRNRQQQHEPGGAARSCAVSGEAASRARASLSTRGVFRPCLAAVQESPHFSPHSRMSNTRPARTRAGNILKAEKGVHPCCRGFFRAP